jgi:hypothetical protein
VSIRAGAGGASDCRGLLPFPARLRHWRCWR